MFKHIAVGSKKEGNFRAFVVLWALSILLGLLDQNISTAKSFFCPCRLALISGSVSEINSLKRVHHVTSSLSYDSSPLSQFYLNVITRYVSETMWYDESKRIDKA